MFSFFPFPKESDSFRGAFSRLSHDCASAPSWVWSDFHWLQEKLWVLFVWVLLLLLFCLFVFESLKQAKRGKKNLHQG